jgi:hypothetical protein
MDLGLTSDQIALQARARNFADSVALPQTRDGYAPKPAMRDAAE